MKDYSRHQNQYIQELEGLLRSIENYKETDPYIKGVIEIKLKQNALYHKSYPQWLTMREEMGY